MHRHRVQQALLFERLRMRFLWFQAATANSRPCVALQAVSHQPVSVCINANTTAFKLYAGGVFDAPCPTKLDHAVLVRCCFVCSSHRNGLAQHDVAVPQ